MSMEEIEIVCIKRGSGGRIVGIMQSGGPIVDLIKMKQFVEGAKDTYVAMKNGKKVKIYPTANYPFLTTNPDNLNENDLDFLPSCP